MKATMEMSAEMLIKLLHLPKDTLILDASVNRYFRNHPVLVFTISHPDIQKDHVLPVWKANYDKDGNKTDIEFVEW